MNLKITILGDNSVGKSSLLAKTFYSYTKDTLGPDMITRKTTIGDKILTVQVDIKLCIITFYYILKFHYDS